MSQFLFEREVSEILGFVRALHERVPSALLEELLQQQKRTNERLDSIMANLQDFNNIQQQLSIDVEQQNADIQNVGAALASNVAALNEAAASLKSQNPNIDLTVLNAVIKTVEANHLKLVDFANSATAATAAAQTVLTSGIQGVSGGAGGGVGPTNSTVDANTLTDPSTAASQPAASPSLVVPGSDAVITDADDANATAATA